MGSVLKFLAHIFTWWHDWTIGTWLHTRLRGVRVGEDALGNRYYQDKSGKRRWVIYNGEVEASRVPADWHGWLHYTVDTPPHEGGLPPRKDWEKDHVPNLTGTEAAWHRPGSLREVGAERREATGDYEAWRPDA